MHSFSRIDLIAEQMSNFAAQLVSSSEILNAKIDFSENTSEYKPNQHDRFYTSRSKFY